jgi:multisubunit Na+/H+ antiporter MnhG subunit
MFRLDRELRVHHHLAASAFSVHSEMVSCAISVVDPRIKKTFARVQQDMEIPKPDMQFIKAMSLPKPKTISMGKHLIAVSIAFAVGLSAEAWVIVAIFALMFLGVTIAALWFAHSSSKIQSRKEIQKRKIDVVDKHFNDMLRIECPYCKTIYRPSEPACPNCKASIKTVILPEMPE